MRSSWSVRVLLPAALALAEGSWLAVLYAALQAGGKEIAYLGPLELGALVVAGMAWGRRRRWTSPAVEALGLPLLALLCGVLGWLLAPDVRVALSEGNLIRALSLHVPGWLAALAFWRGQAHRFPADATVTEHWLARWAVPGLAIPWLLGYAFADGQLQDDFAAAALIGTLFFIGSAFTALGLKRLEALRLLGAIVGPLQTFILLLVLLTAPVFLAAAIVAGWLGSMVPGEALKLPTFTVPRGEPGSDLPFIILGVIVASIFIFEILALVVLLWMVYGGKRRGDPFDEPFEERAIVPPVEDEDDAPPVSAAGRRRVPVSDEVTAAYLAALDALAIDGRWPRRANESPAAHLARIRAAGFGSGAFGRLAAAYQLVRYGGRSLRDRERSRSRSRLDGVRALLTRS